MSMVQQTSLPKLHRLVRLAKWEAILQMSERSDTMHPDQDSVIHNDQTSIIPLTLQKNSIGWTAVHFTALHGAPNLLWWKWMLTKVLEDYALYRERMKSNDNHGIYYEYLENPFFLRTQAGHSATDLFFSKRLHPFPFEKPDVRRDADLLVEGINIILKLHEDDADHVIILELRRRILEKMNEERTRQRRDGTSSNSLLLGLGLNRNSSGKNYPTGSCEIDGQEELEHEMSLHDHVHEEEEDHIGDNHERLDITHSALAEENMDVLVNFWHEMELLVIASTRLTLRLTDDNDTNQINRFIVHELAKVGCPNEIAKLAIKLYPEEVRHFHEGNLPLHIASCSHNTSALATGENATTSPMLNCLLDVYPQGASIPNSDGRYPINLALLAGKTWLDGVGDIFRADPNIIINGSVDCITNLPSFMIAALPRSNAKLGTESKFNERIQTNQIDSHVALEEELRASSNTSKTILSMWRFLPDQSKLRALAEARSDIELIRLTTIFELLRIAPGLLFGTVSSETSINTSHNFHTDFVI